MYSNFDKIEDFLSDESFVQWVKNPNNSMDSFWENWLAANPDKRQDALAARQIILSTIYKHKYEMEKAESDALLARIQSFKTQHDAAEMPPSVKIVEMPRRNWHRVGWWAVAASLTLLVVVGSVYQLYINPNSENAIAYKEFSTQAGERKQITLSDGSVVTLNSKSLLRVPTPFANNIRQVVLEGEAFFDITKNPDKPFVVKTPNFETKVLGTSFNVLAYPNDPNQHVAVVTGKVKMTHNEQISTLLLPHEMGIFNPKNKQIVKTDFNQKTITGWKDGFLVFDKADFETAFKQIEAWFGVEIVVDKRVILRGRYSGEYQNSTIHDVLQGMAYTSGFTYTIKNKVINISN